MCNQKQKARELQPAGINRNLENGKNSGISDSLNHIKVFQVAGASPAVAKFSKTQTQILRLLGVEGALADYELVAHAGRWNIPGTPQKWRSARAQLVAAGHVEASPNEFRPTEYGQKAQVWRLAKCV